MKNNRSVSSLALTAGLLLASSIPALAIVTPALMISDGSGNSITVDGNGAVTYGGSCTATTCTTTSATGAGTTPASVPGTVSWSGTIGNFVISPGTAILGQSKPALKSPYIDVGINASTVLGGTLTVKWTDVGFAGINPTSFAAMPAFVNPGSANYTLYVDNTNAAFGTGTTSISQSGVTTGIVTGSGGGITANPFSMTAVESVTMKPANQLVDDFGFGATAGSLVAPPSPMITLTKSVVGPTTVNAFTKVTYSYTVKNTGNVTLTNVVITDDNATPTYTKDDFTVCTVASLAAGASQTCTASVYPPVTQGANDSAPGQQFNYSNYHPGGTIVCKSLSNGDIQFTYLEDEETADNTYGNGASGDWNSSSYGSGSGGWGGGWGGSWGSTGNQLQDIASKNAEFQIFDARGNKCLDFNANYVTYNPNYISGYGPGSISCNSGSSQNIGSYSTSICDNLNRSKTFAKNCTNNSPGNPDWETKCGYTVTVHNGSWGSNGFGGIKCIGSNNGNSKGSGHNQHQCQPVNSTATNTAVAIAVYGTGATAVTVTSNKATATVTIIANPTTTSKCVPVPTTCNVYGQAPVDCKPQSGGHDGSGYSYCDALISNQITCKDGTPFQVGSAYGPSATCGGSISLPNGKYSSLKFLGAGVNGNQTNQCFTINYTDGTHTSIYQNLSDWCYPANFSGESIAVSMPYRVAPDGSSQYINTNLYEYTLPVNNSKTVQSVTLPNNRNTVVHAITMVP